MEGVFGNVRRLAVTGNNKLCGGIPGLHLQSCPIRGLKHAKHYKIKLIVVILSVISILLMMIIILTIYCMRKRNHKQYSDSPTTNPLAKVSYPDLHNGTDGFSPSNLLVIHCDLKPSNVLLDDDMIAHVSDFGIARLVSAIDNTSHKESSTIGIKGTIGYAPPEYGMGSEISTYGDMYSFGVLMLEMLTGRRPTNEMFEDGQNLH
ncbi:kinase-like protein, partial [Trifolium medium]|nr:kinase-like protein [Trifolium medium]